MIGSISYPVRVSSIGSDPPDMIVNDFFAYKDNQYVSSDTIQPGCAYWVRANKSGKLILDTASSTTMRKLIKIVHNGELPPPPPGDQPITLKEIPNQFALGQNSPNPFNPSTEIRYNLQLSGYVTLKINDIVGREITTLINGYQEAGYKTVNFDAGGLPSGIYFYRMTTSYSSKSSGQWYTDIKKMILLR